MLAACLAAKADDIRGHIVDAGSNDAVAYATVTITDSHNRKLTTVSDISGYFMFQDLSSDRYTITVSYLGYHTLTQTYTSRNGETVTLTLKLKTGQPRTERGGSDGARVARYHYVVRDRPQSHRASAAVEFHRPVITIAWWDNPIARPHQCQHHQTAPGWKWREQLRCQCDGNTVCSRWHPDEYQCQHADREAGIKRHRR